MDPTVAAVLRQRDQQISSLQKQLAELQKILVNQPRSPQDIIDSIPGRRVFYMLTGSQAFTTSQDGVRGNPISMLVSQDGPFIMTHFPIVMWRSSLPSNATDLGRWRPVYSWPLADQVLDTNIVELSYEITDSGSQRNFQNAATPPLLSRPDKAHWLPVPTLFAPNTTVTFTPTYHNILFNDSTTTTEGTLVVSCPGYRIVNM